MSAEEFKTAITGKFVVADTNILIKAFENPSYFKGFFEFLIDCNCDIANSELVNFEFTRNDYLPEIIKLKEEFLAKINATFTIPYTNGILKEALEIAKVYSHQGIQKGQISLVDCCIAALLKQYDKKLFLVTLNHLDFPISLFDREYIFPINAGDNVMSLAFYRFNNEKWQKLQECLKKIKIGREVT